MYPQNHLIFCVSVCIKINDMWTTFTVSATAADVVAAVAHYAAICCRRTFYR